MRCQSVSSGVRARAWQAAIDGLQRVGAAAAAERLGPVERLQPAADQQQVPARAVLVEQQDRLALRADPRPDPRRLDLHQRDEAVDLGLVRGEPGEDPPEPQRVLAERRPDPVLAGGRRVALVEDQVDHLEDDREPLGELVPARRLERPRPPRRASSWRARCAARPSARGRGRRARSPRCGARRASAASARRGPRAESTGWQQVKIRLSRSSPISSSARRRGQRTAAPLEVAADLLPLALEALGRGACRRWRGSWRWSSARRRDSAGRRRAASSRAPRPAPPGRGPRRGRCPPSCERGRRSAGPTRSSRRPRRSG